MKYCEMGHRGEKQANAVLKNGTSRLAGHRIAANLQFVKKKKMQLSVKCIRMRYAYGLFRSVFYPVKFLT